ncbi:hypothetical protein EDC04DRAFT_2914417 [Pisolithus marmoratus]|nr:hypothetical protein EDC04DRAFT_2914417 [Pisolithus marmoratus]
MTSSGPQSSHARSIFSADTSCASTVPTSHASSLCSSFQGDQDIIQHAHGHSSHLKKLALASQTGVEAPSCMSRVVPEGFVSQPQVLDHDSQEDHRWPTMLRSQPREVPSSLHSKELDDPDSPSHHLTGLWHTASFYHTCLDGARLHGHTLFATPNENEDHLPVSEDNYNEPPIDETSPSDDKCLAESALWGETKLNLLPLANGLDQVQHTISQSNDPGHMNNNAKDVVAAHQQCNCALRLPNNFQLNAIWDWQSSTLHQVPQTQSATSPPSGVSQSSEAVNPPVPPVSPAVVKAEPWQIHFYKPAVQDILECVKQFSHCDAASINAVPLRAHFNTKAVEYMEEAISKRLSHGLSVSNGWWPHYMNDVTRLNCCKVNSGIAKDLLGDCGVFLRDGVDENGHMNNLAHPALAGLITNFFYMGSSSLGQIFPEVFMAEVPRVTVAIAAMVLKVILDEVASSKGRVSFRVGTYMPVYLEMLGLMKKCDTSAIHTEKTRSLRVKWATLGSNSMTECEVTVLATTGFDVELD